jgi:hypothetical protein
LIAWCGFLSDQADDWTYIISVGIITVSSKRNDPASFIFSTCESLQNVLRQKVVDLTMPGYWLRNTRFRIPAPIVIFRCAGSIHTLRLPVSGSGRRASSRRQFRDSADARNFATREIPAEIPQIILKFPGRIALSQIIRELFKITGHISPSCQWT